MKSSESRREEFGKPAKALLRSQAGWRGISFIEEPVMRVGGWAGLVYRVDWPVVGAREGLLAVGRGRVRGGIPFSTF